ncbi:uncharacterized protein EV420DRAFT_1485648 [Desarmillaria tabescens]|uniref:Uncharacterized protein n=1 Tax=Armillaria tabescens TaxID=1929756 RepID=A0AA39MPZ2_ARMTA|nr:uncharacterized protein EV420DRAFT_1485648 [Desarmillaria tabescens]KAK0441485.1 hypothetical protein EV420DRAFT_1485648 [Desarmillaria tabescens]
MKETEMMVEEKERHVVNQKWKYESASLRCPVYERSNSYYHTGCFEGLVVEVVVETLSSAPWAAACTGGIASIGAGHRINIINTGLSHPPPGYPPMGGFIGILPWVKGWSRVEGGISPGHIVIKYWYSVPVIGPKSSACYDILRFCHSIAESYKVGLRVMGFCDPGGGWGVVDIASIEVMGPLFLFPLPDSSRECCCLSSSLQTGLDFWGEPGRLNVESR